MMQETDFISQDILGYLQQHQQKELLRFVAVGSVDDGKSTLIGRLLHDTHGVYEDQLSAVKRASVRAGMEIDFSLFTDGLKAEREQGITIDVAYRNFSTAKRKFIIADTRGHVRQPVECECQHRDSCRKRHRVTAFFVSSNRVFCSILQTGWLLFPPC